MMLAYLVAVCLLGVLIGFVVGVAYGIAESRRECDERLRLANRYRSRQ